MKRSLLLFIASITLPNTAHTNIVPEVHKLCLTTVDYSGFVKTMTGNSNQNRVTMDQGVSLSEGKACPEGYAYKGGGTCQIVECYGSDLFLTIGGEKLSNFEKI
tara:strand:+ start:359 stop:670 length:312 start_codon:yes stop_codon:yes gene_type:complete